jgi:hypothetical protein
LCNELEEYLDLGIVYCGEAKRGSYEERQQTILTICERLGMPELRDELAEAFAQANAADLPAAICNPTRQPATMRILSPSYRPTMLSALAQFARRVRSRK